MFSNRSIEPKTTITAEGEGGQKDQIAAAIATEFLSSSVPASSHEPHSQKELNEKKSQPSQPPKRGPKKRQAKLKAEGSTGSNSPGENGADDAWNWLLKVEESYQETIANAKTELENRIYADNSGSEDEDDEKNYKYYYRGPEPKEPTRAVTSSSEPWFAAGYTDYRESYSSSESDEEEPVYEETTVRPGVLCGACHKEECGCTKSILTGLAKASLSETGEDDESAEK